MSVTNTATDRHKIMHAATGRQYKRRAPDIIAVGGKVDTGKKPEPVKKKKIDKTFWQQVFGG